MQAADAREDLGSPPAAEGEQHRDPLALDAARRERQRLQRDRVEPLDVVRPDQHGRGLGGPAQQLAHRRVEHERGAAGRAAGDRAERVPVRRRQAGDQAGQRPQQPVQPRVRDGRLPPHPRGGQDPERGCGAVRGRLQQGGPAHAGLCDDGQRAAVAVAGAVEQRADGAELAVLSVDPRGRGFGCHVGPPLRERTLGGSRLEKFSRTSLYTGPLLDGFLKGERAHR